MKVQPLFHSLTRRIVLFSLGICVLHPPRALATGDWNSLHLLEDPEFAAIASPEFWFELEMKDLAKSFPVKEKHVTDLTTAEAELASFDEAVKAGKVGVKDSAALRRELEKLRSILSPKVDAEAEKETPPAEQPTDSAGKPTPAPAKPKENKSPLPAEEFSLYQRGADSYRNNDYDDARAAWKALLALPAENRRYRSVWAAYMLGRTEIDSLSPDSATLADGAVPFFTQTRDLAAQGFSDPLGLAAASYGWEGYVWNSRDPEQAAPEKALVCYLKQLSAGDDRAFTSIRFVLRQQYQLGNAFEEEGDQQKAMTDEKWAKLAASPLLRQIITRWHLAMGQDRHNRWAVSYQGEPDRSCAKWLALLEKANPKAEEADRLAWLAYRDGAYDQAQRWLKMVQVETRLSLWLSAKLALRNGETAKAAAAMEKVDALFKAPERLVISQGITGTPLPKAAAKGDHAAILLGQGKFTESLAAFLEAGHWQDAAYVAERVLTLKELQDFVNVNYPKPAKRESGNLDRRTLSRVVNVPEGEKSPSENPESNPENERYADPRAVLEDAIIRGDMTPEDGRVKDAIAWRLRWLLARRMVREDQEAAARPYLPRDIQPALDAYVEALSKAANAKAPKLEQARNWWTAAWLVRHAGMELMGMELEPDGAWDGGAFEAVSVAIQRKTGTTTESEFAEDPNGDATTKPKLTKKIKFGVAPSAEEKKRLAKHALPREYRFHYLWVAANLAKKAAALMADGTEEKADVLNQAGAWLFSRDVKGEEWFFFEIKRTCPATAIGKKVLETKHTAPQAGPWSGKPDEDEANPQ